MHPIEFLACVGGSSHGKKWVQFFDWFNSVAGLGLVATVVVRVELDFSIKPIIQEFGGI